MALKIQQLFLKPDEGRFLLMAAGRVLEELVASANDETIPWNPETRKQFKEMIAAGQSLKTKLSKLGFDIEDVPPYNEGDEKDFLTKES